MQILEILMTLNKSTQKIFNQHWKKWENVTFQIIFTIELYEKSAIRKRVASTHHIIFKGIICEHNGISSSHSRHESSLRCTFWWKLCSQTKQKWWSNSYRSTFHSGIILFVLDYTMYMINFSSIKESTITRHRRQFEKWNIKKNLWNKS